MRSSLFNNKTITQCLPCISVSIVAFIYALIQAIKTCNGQWDGMIAAMLLGLAIVYFSFIDIFTGKTQLTPPVIREQIVAWGLIILSPCIPLIFSDTVSDLPHYLAVALIAIGCVLFFHGTKTALKLSPALIIFCVFIPLREQIILMVSYPLRLISTIFSVEALKLFGVNIQRQLTTITLPSTQIVITDACSGIQQLEALLLVSYIIIKMQSKSTIWNICQYLFLLPIIIISNSCRIIVTILLYGVIGERVLDNSWHMGLGYCLVLLSSLLIWYSGLLFPDDKPAAPSQKDEI